MRSPSGSFPERRQQPLFLRRIAAKERKEHKRPLALYLLRFLRSLVAIESSARDHLREIPEREFRDTHVFAVSLKATHNVEILGFHLSLSTLCRHDVVHAQLEDHGYADDPARRRFENSVLMRERVTGARFDELWQFLDA